MDSISKEIIDRVRRFRNYKGETQQDLAKATGIKHSTIAGKESYRFSYTIEDLVVLSKHFGVSLDYLITGKEDANNELLELKDNLIEDLKKELHEERTKNKAVKTFVRAYYGQA